ncbi:MAG: sigma-70 family RNA polymerase sigma factor [archaeon]
MDVDFVDYGEPVGPEGFDERCPESIVRCGLSLIPNLVGRRIRRRDPDFDDCCQDVAVKILNRGGVVDNYRGGPYTNFVNYLTRVVDNAFRDILRKKYVRGAYPLDEVDEKEFIADSDEETSLGDLYYLGSLVRRLLPERDSRIFLDKALTDDTFNELGERFGIYMTSCKWSYCRSKRRLQESLAQSAIGVY